MKRIGIFVGGVFIGVLLGGGVALVARGRPELQVSTTTSSSNGVAVRPVDQTVLLVWTSGGLPAGLAELVGGLPGVASLTVVRGDLITVPGPDGVIPIDALAVEGDYQEFVPAADRAEFDRLGARDAILGTTSATLRRLARGDAVEVGEGVQFTVRAVVPDVVVGGAEMVLSIEAGEALGVVTPRFLLVSIDGERAAVEAAIRGLIRDVPVRVRGPGETPFMRHGDAVLPQSFVKAAFGEFSYSAGSGRGIIPDEQWVAANIVTEEVPILGTVRCHREVVPALRGALQQLVDEGVARVVDVAGFAGCYEPRLIAPGAGLSRHSWGIALDINYSENQKGVGSSQDPRLVEVMERWGFGWGGRWLIPDPAHFEWIRPPIP